MASPAVAGVAALLMDAEPAYREQPAAVRARLMASAIRPDAFLDDAAGFPLHNGDGPGPLQHRYGLGKVSARTSVLNRDEADGWFGGAAVVEVGDGEYGYRDIEVPAGASRLDIVMTWDERPADTVVSTVLNDLDLWVDRDADCAPSQPGACGEAASRSTKDNVEWLILRDPLPGTYRLKVVPKYARTDTPRAAVAWTVIRGPSTPQLAVSAVPAVAADPGRPFEVETTVTTDGYVAAGTTLRVDCRGEPGICERVELLALKASGVAREDAVSRTLDGESGDAIALGEVAAGEQQAVKLVFKDYPSAARFRLFLTASAWNAASASTSVDFVVGEPDAPATPASGAPGNDNFAAATELTGDAGSLGFDLLLATPDPGEPAFTQNLLDDFGRFESQRRPRSLWYRWTSPMTGLVRFAIPGSGEGIGDDVQLDVFEARGLGMQDLEHIGVKFGGGLTFAAQRGQTYVVRLGIMRAQLFEYDAEGDERVSRRAILPLSLHWQRASLPANDNFELAAEIAGASGEHAGSNLSATEQAGERLQPMAASTWHRWTAPADGDYGFKIDRRYLNVTAFTGTALDQLRLVSGEPGEMAVFPARAGEVYTIAVAAHSAFSSGSDYVLSWGPEPRGFGTNDDMANAEPMLGAPAFFHFGLADLAAATVEPGEPVESGVRTAWWTWTAPLSSRYTWRATALFSQSLAVSVVEVGDSLVALGESSADRQTEQLVSFDGVAGRQYLISAGLPIDRGFDPTLAGPISFEWGPTPANDELATAGVMAGVSGTVLGSNQFATVSDGEPVGLLGDSSVWWTWDVPETRWYRVSLANQFGASVVSAFEMHADGTLAPEPVAVSRRLPDPILVFRAEAGERYALRVGTDGTSSGSEFALNWAPNGSPTWLRYAGAVADGDVDPAGNILDLGSPDSIALNDDGSELYVATESGLQVYARRAANGALSHMQTLDGIDDSASLFWDAHASAVIAVACSGVRRFASAETGGLGEATEIAGVVPCIGGELPPGTVLRDASGTFAYFVGPLGIVTLRFNEDRTGVDLAGGVPVFGLTAAALGVTDEFLYVATEQGLQVFPARCGERCAGARRPAPGTRHAVDAAARGADRALPVRGDGRTRGRCIRSRRSHGADVGRRERRRRGRGRHLYQSIRSVDLLHRLRRFFVHVGRYATADHDGRRALPRPRPEPAAHAKRPDLASRGTPAAGRCRRVRQQSAVLPVGSRLGGNSGRATHLCVRTARDHDPGARRQPVAARASLRGDVHAVRGRPRTSHGSAASGCADVLVRKERCTGPGCGRRRPRTAEAGMRSASAHRPWFGGVGVRGRPRPQGTLHGAGMRTGTSAHLPWFGGVGVRGRPRPQGTLHGAGMRTGTSAHRPWFGGVGVRGRPRPQGTLHEAGMRTGTSAHLPWFGGVGVRGRPRPQGTLHEAGMRTGTSAHLPWFGGVGVRGRPRPQGTLHGAGMRTGTSAHLPWFGGVGVRGRPRPQGTLHGAGMRTGTSAHLPWFGGVGVRGRPHSSLAKGSCRPGRTMHARLAIVAP